MMSWRSRAAVVLALVVLVAVGGLGTAGCRPQLAGGGSGSGGEGTVPGTGGSGDTGGAADAAGGGTGDNEATPAEETAACPLCGEVVTKGLLLHRPLAVCVDNQAQARPQSGLNDACLVYEVLAEGGITRFVAFFLHKDTAAIGPVRSLRPYFLDLTMPLGAVVAHVGGSPAALADVADLRPTAMDIDEMGYPEAFWRSEERKAPHNCYTGTSLLRSASLDLGYEVKRLSGTTPVAFNFGPAPDKVALPAGQSVSRFTLHYAAGAGEYAVTYDYDEESGQWVRYLSGRAHLDSATGKQLRAGTVIVQYVQSSIIPGDPEGRLEVDLAGKGQGLVFCQGRVFEVKWSKASRTSVCTYTDASGDPLTLPPGPVWVLVAPPGSRLETQ